MARLVAHQQDPTSEADADAQSALDHVRHDGDALGVGQQGGWDAFFRGGHDLVEHAGRLVHGGPFPNLRRQRHGRQRG